MATLQKHRLTFSGRRKLIGFIFVVPWVLGFLIFFLIPIIQSAIMSLAKMENISAFSFHLVGMDNYKEAFVSDVNFIPMFIEVLKNTLINTPLICIFSIYIATLLNRKIHLRGVFRTVFFLPVILGAGFVMEQLMQHNVQQNAMEVATSMLLPDDVMRYLGPSFSAVVMEFLTRITMILWSSGVQIIIFLTGLQSIPTTVYEAAQIDSASEWETFWLITFPMLAPMMLLNLVYTVIDSFSSASNPIVEYIRKMGFENNKFEYASALGWMYFLFIFVVIAVIFLVTRRFVDRVSDR